ncbi:MAG: pirin family protein, partial [Betaproteobacteria bacterium]|nr:pirin family protein [Betaproteobacteria bacterium]
CGFDEQALPAGSMAVLSNDGDGLRLAGAGSFLLVSGQPIGEPIVQMGPFVMNTREAVLQAVHDYQTGRLG